MRGLFLAWAIIFQLYASAQHSNNQLSSFKNIPEILVKPKMGVMRISRDTIEFKVGEHLDPGVVKVEDLFSQFIGFNVTDEGRVYYNGKEITNVLIDGDPVSVFDYRMVSKHLNASMFSSVELIQHYNANRLDRYFLSADGIAVNLKLKKSFVRKFNVDLGLKYGSPKGLVGKVDFNRIGSNVKSISAIDKNINGIRAVLPSQDLTRRNSDFPSEIKFTMHSLVEQGIPFKRDYLPNNFSNHIQTHHSIRFSKNEKLYIDISDIRSNQRFTQLQQLHYYSNELLTRVEKRATSLYQSQSSNSLKLFFVHDHMKNNRGEYQLIVGKNQLMDQLKDTLILGSAWINSILTEQQQRSMHFSVEEKFRVFNKNLIEFKAQSSINRLNRLAEADGFQKNIIQFEQSVMLFEMASSFRKGNHLLHTGLRIFREQRESNAYFQKKYSFIEHQYRLGKKLQFHHEFALGNGQLRFKQKAKNDWIYHVQAQLLFTKSLFNQFFVSATDKRALPEVGTWMIDSLLHLSGMIQYSSPIDHFTTQRKIELGKTYHNVYTGIQYRITFNYLLKNNDEMHAIGFHDFYTVDSVGFDGRFKNLQFLSESSVFLHASKIRLAASYQFISSDFLQSLIGKRFLVNIANHHLKISSKTSWQKSWNAEMSTSVYHSKSIGHFSMPRNVLLNHQIGIKYRGSDKLFTGIQVQLIKTNHDRLFQFIDFLFQFRTSRKIDIILTGINLMNRKWYQQQYISSIGIQNIYTDLAGRKIQIEIRKSF